VGARLGGKQSGSAYVGALVEEKQSGSAHVGAVVEVVAVFAVVWRSLFGGLWVD
jgi:hypothetical protein